MAKQTIGTAIGGGDPGYVGGNKANANFDELFARMLDAEARMLAAEARLAAVEASTPTPTTPTIFDTYGTSSLIGGAVSGFAALANALDARLTARGA